MTSAQMFEVSPNSSHTGAEQSTPPVDCLVDDTLLQIRPCSNQAPLRIGNDEYMSDTSTICSHNMSSLFTYHCYAGFRRSIKLTNFCWRGLVSWENRPIKSLNHGARHFWRHDSDDKKMADDKYAHASMLLAIVTAKQHKKRTVWVQRWLLDR